MKANPAFEPFTNLIEKGMTENPNTSTPFEPWHDGMRQYVVDKVLPAKENIPLFVANYRKAYFPKDPKASLPIGTHLITAENRYAARIPSVKDLVRKEILGFSLNFLTGEDKGKAIVSFPIQHMPELADSMAVLRAKAEVKGAKKPWPKDPTGKGPLIEARFKDVQEALDCPETRIHIVYNESHKAVAYALTQQTTPNKINVSYVCSNEKGASKTLWRHVLTENITCITANNVTNPVTHDYFEHMGLIDIGDGTKDMHLKNGNLAKQKCRLGI
jgi:hypothetical protein